MIPKPYIAKWQEHAPWKQFYQVEQDLVISRALVEIFSDEFLRENLAFRGGTALHKLYLNPAPRYSEDIDLVQIKPGPIKPIMQRLNEVITFFKEPRKTQVRGHGAKALYRFNSEYEDIRLRLKLEINCKEHFNVLPWVEFPFEVESDWFTGSAKIRTYSINELLGTKLRALYQRSKGRDLFDLDYSRLNMKLDIDQIIKCFAAYITFSTGNKPPSQKEFLLNIEEKEKDPNFTGDMEALLRSEIKYNQEVAFEWLKNELITKMISIKMTSINQRAELQAKIWKIANDVRGSVDGWDFKQFVLGTLFYRFISENFTDYIEGGDESVNYAELSDDVISPEIKDDAIKTKGYFIFPSQLFVNVAKTANTNTNLNTDLAAIFSAIENSANGYPSEPDIKGLFADFDTTSTRLGNTVENKNSPLAGVLKAVEELDFGDFDQNQIDFFGDAYEFLIHKYAANAGKSGGEFFTPTHVSKLIAKLALHGQSKVNKIYDPAAGSGSLLLQAKDQFDNHLIEEGFFDQEINLENSVKVNHPCRIKLSSVNEVSKIVSFKC